MLKFFWPIIKPYKWYYLLMIQAPIISSFYYIASGYSLKMIVDIFSSQNIVYSRAFYPMYLYVGMAIVNEIVWRISHIAWMKSQPFIRADITAKAFDYVQNHSYIYFQNTHSSSITSKIKGITDGYNNIWGAIHHRIVVPMLNVVMAIFAILFVNIWVCLFIMLWSCIFFTIMVIFSIKIGKLAQITTESKHKSIGLIGDNIANIFSVFSFASKKRELTKISNFLIKDTAHKDYVQIIMELKSTICGGIMYVGMMIALFIFMINLHKNNQITTGDFVFVITLVYRFIDEIWNLVSQMGEFMAQIGDFRSSFSIIATPQQIIDKPNAGEILVSKGDIDIKNMSFSYGEKKIFDSFNLDIKAGQKVGLVGHSGAGKSSLISLLVKYFTLNNGAIYIDNQNIADFTSDSVRSQISIIPQDIMLFHRSIYENISYAKPDSTETEVFEAAKNANIHDFIMQLPQQYNTEVGERGVKLSGGQRQRIAIARAILKNAPILILDEATSALDSETEQKIQRSINNMLDQNNATVIAIAHRLSTIKHLDRIIVMNDGKIVEDGNFDHLIAKNGVFKELWHTQVGGMIA